ncbi:hypothetical protein GOV05_02470 [Candidatus Woesearchaeota archaeon]|nr:hypothetical protein [Candidatus Woesearchaeota archaeon]
MRIAVDLDQVLADILTPLLKYYNKKYDKNEFLDDTKPHNITDAWKLTKQEILVVLEDFFTNSEEFRAVQVMPGALTAIKSLKNNKHELFVLTSRPKLVMKESVKWVEKHFGDNTFKDMFFTNDDFDFSNNNKSKYLKEHNIKLLIDDNPSYCLEAAQAGFQTILLNNNGKHQLVRKKQENPKILLAKNWSEVLVHIEKLNK